MRLFQLNTTLNTTSTGRIAEEIGRMAIVRGHESYMGANRIVSGTQSKSIKIGNQFDTVLHAVQTRLFDRHGLGSRQATRKLINDIKHINPSMIGIHNIHGYYVNIEILFSYLKEAQVPIVWTLHDCWPFTGHCTYFDSVGCERWKTECYSCPKKSAYPESWLVDRSRLNFQQKKFFFQGLDKLTIVTPSHWLKNLVEHSFLKDYPIRVIPNGVDTNVFKPMASDSSNLFRKEAGQRVILGVANVWDNRKGLEDFKQLSTLLPSSIKIVLVGLTKQQARSLPQNITAIERTENQVQLAALYSMADFFVNPTWQDNFPTTNLEALACGTPVITYQTGGSPEALDANTGRILKKGDVQGIVSAIEKMTQEGLMSVRSACQSRAKTSFDKELVYGMYINLYESLVG